MIKHKSYYSIPLAISITIALSTSLTSLSYAETSTELNEIQVVSTATRTEQPIEGVAASVIVVDSKDIEKMGAQTLKDIFNNTPGLIIQYGTFPASSAASKSSVSIRGVGATGSLWLLDGRRLAGEVKNPYDMDRIPASMIERIEIVKGSMSALYGADAVGGVINIITKKPTEGFQADVSARYGQNGDGEAGNTQINATVRGGKDNMRFSFYASNQSTNRYNETEKTKTRVGSGQHAPSKVPPKPGFINPKNPKTKGNPFYLHPVPLIPNVPPNGNPFSSGGSVKPMPLDPSKLASDKAAVQNAFSDFRDAIQSKVKDSYDVPVSYREDSDVSTIGGRLEFDINERITAGAEFNWFEEERDGTYRAAFHPMGFMPPVGHKTNPIVGHKADGTPISFFEKFKKLRGRIPAFDVPVDSHDENNRIDMSADVSFEVNEDLMIKSRVYRSDYEKRNTTTMSEFADFGYPNKEKSGASGMSADVIITAFETNATWAANDEHLVTFGAEIRDEKRSATVFSQGPGFDARNVDYKALYVQDEWDISDSLHIVLGGRYDEYHQDSYVDALGGKRDAKKDTKSTFRIGMVKNFSDALNLRVNVAQGYRIPDIRELFIQKQTPAGLQLGAQTVDPRFNKTAYDLKPESVNSFEVGFSGRKGKMNYELVAFHNEIDDRIQHITVDANKDGRDDYFTFQNVSSATTTGLEARLGFQINENMGANFSWTELDTENKDTGKDLEFNPERIVSTGFNWKANSRLNLGTSITHTGKQFYTKGGKGMHTKDYTLVNVNASYALDNKGTWEVFGGVDNIFDEKVEKRLGSNPGPFMFVGVRGSFK